MSNRPSLARKVTPGSEKKRQDELDQGVRMTVDGEVYEVRVGDLTAPLARELRQSTGHSFQGLMVECARDCDLDTVAALVWLARRMRGEDVALDEVTISYHALLGDDFDIDLAGAEEVGDSPEG